MVNVFWFRRDLRLEDNVGLFKALSSKGKVLPLFIFDTNILNQLTNKNDERVSFIWNVIDNLKNELQTKSSDLLVYHGEPVEVFSKLSSDFDINTVFCNEDYEQYALKRDEQVSKFLASNGIQFKSYKDQCIFSKHDVLKKDGTPYTVFTPYKKKWLSLLTKDSFKRFPSEKLLGNLEKRSQKMKMPTLSVIGFSKGQLEISHPSIPENIIKHFDSIRDNPSIEGTSKLGIHLRFGTISIRKCAEAGIRLNGKWLEALIWRDFFMQILFHFPHVEKKAFREKYRKIKWNNNKSTFKKWCEGRTGFPMVDAGMRQLNKTGQMHNRVRMIAGSFLVKQLLIDWRWGEAYFAEKLLDFDLAANNGNWQWVAGTGCDAAPYFRVFNPTLQQKKFDPDFTYIKTWVSEFGTDEYPEPIIDLKKAKERVLKAYKESITQFTTQK